MPDQLPGRGRKVLEAELAGGEGGSFDAAIAWRRAAGRGILPMGSVITLTSLLRR